MKNAGFAISGLLVLITPPALAVPLQSDCRGAGTIGTAVMGTDGTVTLNLRAPNGEQSVLAYHREDPNYARIVSHLGGIRPGEHKPIPSFC